MNLATLATIAYGLLAGLGGIWGYIKSKSKPSLISGVTSGVLLLLAAAIQVKGADVGFLIAKIIILLLIIVFAIRLIKTGKLMPSGIMLAAGIAAEICLL